MKLNAASILVLLILCLGVLAWAAKDCGENEIWNGCGNQCESKCGEDELKPCPRICKPGACACARGFSRKSDGKCVTRDKC